MTLQEKTAPALARWDGSGNNTSPSNDNPAGIETKARKRRRKRKTVTPKQSYLFSERLFVDTLRRIDLDDAQRALVLTAARSMATAKARWALHNARLSLYKQALEVGQ